MSIETSADYWIERASAACGLPARGTETLRPGLELFLDEYKTATTPTAAGREATKGYIVECLAARFRIEDWIVHHPEVLDKPVEKPVFILGLPRAGTTMLVNLLAKDKQRRFYWSWETNREIPPVEAEHLHDDPRIARRVAEIQAAIDAGYLDHSVHVEMGDQPAEEIMLLAQDFKAYLWLVQAQMPRYFNWLLDEADMDSAYIHHKRTLQVLQSRAPGKWTLKTPNHAMAIDAILRVYPDARIVMTHRDPVKATGSSCDSERFFAALQNENLDLHIIGDHNARLLSTEMRRLSAARDANPAAHFYDFHFLRFKADPIAEVRRLYDFLGDDLPSATEAAMRAELDAAMKLRDATGPHTYRFEDFGLSRGGLLELFGDYIERYGIEMER